MRDTKDGDEKERERHTRKENEDMGRKRKKEGETEKVHQVFFLSVIMKVHFSSCKL